MDGQRQFSGQAKQASKDVEGIGKSAQKADEQTKKSGKNTALSLLKTAAAAGVTVKAWSFLKGSVSTTLDLAKSTKGLQRVTGLDAKQAQAWVLIAKERGIQTNQLQMGMATLGRSLGGLGGPSKAADTALAKLGLTSAQLAALPMDIRMGMIADSFKGLPDGVQKAALAQKLFGRAGRALLPILNSGSKGIQEQMDAANKMVPPLGASGKQALELAKKQRELKMATTGVKVAIGTALIPVISSLANVAAPLIQTFATWMSHSKLLTYAVLGLAGALVGLMIASTIAGAIDGLTASTIANKVADIATAAAAKAWAAAQWLLNAALSANPIVLVIGLVIALGAAIFLAYKKVGWFHDAVNAMGRAVVTAFGWVKNAAINVFGWIKNNWPLLLGILTGPFGLAIALIIKNFGKIKSAASSVVNSVRSIFSAIPGIIKSMFTGAVGIAADVGRSIADWLNANTPFGDKVHVGPVSFTLPALAQGGIMRMGGPALVGEQGPEIVSLPAGAMVTPLPAAGAMHVTITTPVYLDKRQIGLSVREWNSDEAARKGKVA
jgi:hypothetical protein